MTSYCCCRWPWTFAELRAVVDIPPMSGGALSDIASADMRKLGLAPAPLGGASRPMPLAFLALPCLIIVFLIQFSTSRADNISSYSTLIDRLEQCEGISQQDDRLSCFDAVAKVIAPVQKTDSSTYKEFKFADLKTDIQLLNGIKVSVAGRGYMLSDDFIMSEERGSVDMIYVNTSELPREERLTINRSCSGGCVVTVKGTVGKIRNGFGIYADHIEVQ